ncbi:SPFH domain-containing protein [Actinomadura syzygii]|uniref:SPFH domain-containing protein n=1 Tax=Actinomadura syzygii TaxID=1427538 RepID=A0A5D0TT91_9ACTN|nr:SPFH domain-containing protein [Actinomadura syzygii]
MAEPRPVADGEDRRSSGGGAVDVLTALGAREGLPGLPMAVLVLAGLVAGAVAVSGLRRVAPSERLVVRRFGRTRGVRGPGLRYLLPLAESGVRVPMGPRPHHLWFKATTGDGVPVRVRALALVGTSDPVRYAEAAAVLGGGGASGAQGAVEGALRAVVADRDLADLASLLADGDDAELVRRVDEAVRPWGATASLVSVTDATVPVREARPRCRCGTGSRAGPGTGSRARQKPPKSPPPPKSPLPKSQPPPMSPPSPPKPPMPSPPNPSP